MRYSPNSLTALPFQSHLKTSCIFQIKIYGDYYLFLVVRNMHFAF
ncbi:hypothetical protein P872_19530 [Rhodonellum psychrophilum GCM71 = DSM 17998]|uniref:Uncharacterized protein n=1 Tax=Rhodonellum psychrophilum GCM71 = DSM 17998 TaxID=1123057 RepID=U5BMG2_9BACT|nr:hypothetical protein P872_19530 [Rhodonellum psychrophilum GCM71 = DSM 17998]